MNIYDINKNFTPGTGEGLNARGAYSYAPAEGSSNILNGGIPMAGKYGGVLPGLGQGSIFNNPDYMNLSPEDKERYIKMYGPSPESALIDKFTSPEYQAQQEAMQDRMIQRGLDAYKKMGDQQMKYNLINQGISGLREGLQRGLTRYSDPYAIAQMTAGIGEAYSKGAAATQGLARLGENITIPRYF
jgi:hypothetical protein